MRAFIPVLPSMLLIATLAPPLPLARAQAGEIFVGPDAGKDTPYILDTFGREETTFQAWGSPGTASKPSRWSAKLKFFVRYKDVSNSDVVMIQVFKGAKALGEATACRPSGLVTDGQILLFDCTAPDTRDWEKLFSTHGAHTIKLTYRKTAAGTDFKDFAVLTVDVEKLKHGSANKPADAWGANHDMKLTVTTLEEAVTSAGRNTLEHAGAAVRAALRQDIPLLVLRTWFKRESRVERSSVTCQYKGKDVAEGRVTSGTRYTNWSFKRKGSADRADALWEQVFYEIGMLKPRPGPRGKGSFRPEPHWLHENPGPYKCVITGDGQVLKEISFTVGADGQIEKPACQLKSFNTLSTVTLVDTVDKKLADVPYDRAVGRKLGFEGRVRWGAGCPPVK